MPCLPVIGARTGADVRARSETREPAEAVLSTATASGDQELSANGTAAFMTRPASWTSSTTTRRNPATALLVARRGSPDPTLHDRYHSQRRLRAVRELDRRPRLCHA